MTDDIRTRKTLSANKMPAVEAPPTRIVEDHMQLDPERVIQAWSESAEVMREVAEAIREVQGDNEHTRQVMVFNRNMLLVGGGVITALHIATVFINLAIL